MMVTLMRRRRVVAPLWVRVANLRPVRRDHTSFDVPENTEPLARYDSQS
jgi:hypothetical protein